MKNTKDKDRIMTMKKKVKDNNNEGWKSTPSFKKGGNL